MRRMNITFCLGHNINQLGMITKQRLTYSIYIRLAELSYRIVNP